METMETHKKIALARKFLEKKSFAYHGTVMITEYLKEFAIANKLDIGEAVDIAFFEFLEKRNVSMDDIDKRVANCLDGAQIPQKL